MTEENVDTQESQGTETTQDQQATTNDSWYGSIEESIAKEPSIERFKDKSINDFAKSYAEAQKLIGRKGMIVPKDAEDKDAWDNVWKTLGKPSDPKEYKADIELPDNMKHYYKEEKFEEFRKLAHDADLTQSQYDKLVKGYMGQVFGELQGMQAKTEQERVELDNELRGEWGQAYDAKVKIAKEAMAQLGELDKSVIDELSKNPMQVKIWANVGDKISGDSMVKGRQYVPMTPSQASQEISEILKDEDNVLYNQGHREHNSRIERLKHLYKIRDSK
jgi:hypothetical protein